MQLNSKLNMVKKEENCVVKKIFSALIVLTFLAGVFFLVIPQEANAFENLSKDGNCTPCHTDGRKAKAAATAKPAPAPAKASAAKPAPAKTAPAPVKVSGIKAGEFAEMLKKAGFTVSVVNGEAVLTREAAAELMVKTLGLKPAADTSVLKAFKDSSKIGSTYKGYVAAAVNEKLLFGYGNKTFVPQGGVDKKTAEALVWRMMSKQKQAAAPAKPVVKGLNVKLGVEGYVGSDTCGKCHGDAYKSWKDTAHSKMGQKIADGSVLQEIKWDAQLSTIPQFDLNGVKVSGLGYAQNTKPIFTIGSVHKQRFVFDTNADGDDSVIDVNDLKIMPQEWIRPANGQGDKWQDYSSKKWKNWKECAGCHFTGVKADVKANKVQVAEFNIGCEACHGPGKQHVASGGDKTKIYSGAQAYSCGACHTRGYNDYTTKEFEFIPNLMPWDDPAKVADKYTHAGENGNELDAFWGNDPVNGPSKKHHQQYLDWRRSGHATIFERNIQLPNFGDSCLKCHSATAYIAAEKGEKVTLADFKAGGKFENDRAGVTCVVCHTSHATKTAKPIGSANLRKSREETCTQCHVESGLMFKGDVTAKMKGKSVVATSIPSGTNLTCVDCHMPKVAKSGVNGDLSSHMFRPITKEEAEKLGMPATAVYVEQAGVEKNREFQVKVHELEAKIKEAEAKLAALDKNSAHYAKAKELLEGAGANYWYLHKDPGAGYHNPAFAQELLDKANANLTEFEKYIQ